MENKTTDELNHEIKSSTDIEDYLKNNSKHLIVHSLTEHLKSLLSDKGLTRAAVVRDCLMSRAYVYQIFSGKKTPSRDKIIALAFGLHLSENEVQTLLKISGNRALYARDERDSIILFSFMHNKTIFGTNNLLFDHGFELLGVPDE